MTRFNIRSRLGFLAIVFALCAGRCFASLQWESLNKKLELQPSSPAASIEFPFKNAGTESVTIHRIKADCGCIVSEASATDIGPNESGSIRIKFLPAAQQGFFQKHVDVFSSTGVYRLTIDAHVRDNFILEPRMFVWQKGTSFVDKEAALEFPIDAQDPRVSLSHAEGVIASLKEIVAGRKYAVVLRPEDSNHPLQRTLLLNVQFGAGTDVISRSIFLVVR